jgi:hypothetical protein
MKVKVIAALTVVVLGLLVAVVSAQTATPTAATSPNEAAPSHLGELITSAKASGKTVTFDFIVPLVTGERVWTVPDDTTKRSISAVGLDYVCFSEPWNDGSRERCTPFNNVSSVTFLK